MDVQFSFSKWLRSAMDEAGMSQAALAEITGITLSTICGYLHDRRYPSYKTLMYLIGIFGKRIEIVDDGGQDDGSTM